MSFRWELVVPGLQRKHILFGQKMSHCSLKWMANFGSGPAVDESCGCFIPLPALGSAVSSALAILVGMLQFLICGLYFHSSSTKVIECPPPLYIQWPFLVSFVKCWFSISPLVHLLIHKNSSSAMGFGNTLPKLQFCYTFHKFFIGLSYIVFISLVKISLSHTHVGDILVTCGFFFFK